MADGTAVGLTGGGENLYVSSTTEKEKLAAASKEADRVSHDDFLKLLTTQLTNQDPLNPMENQDFLSQMAQLQSLDEQIDLADSMAGMRLDMQLRAGSDLIGMDVEGVSTTGATVSGMVNGVAVKSGKTQLRLDTGHVVPYGNVVNVSSSLFETAEA